MLRQFSSVQLYHHQHQQVSQVLHSSTVTTGAATESINCANKASIKHFISTTITKLN